ncbi:hypothetical protein [Bacillus thuringiensis]
MQEWKVEYLERSVLRTIYVTAGDEEHARIIALLRLEQEKYRCHIWSITKLHKE